MIRLVHVFFHPKARQAGYFCSMSAPWPEELPRGFQFERYSILDRVWHGSTATVYRAESTLKGSLVALKIFERSRADEQSDPRRLSKNARIAAAVRHPNLAAILGVGVWQERPYLVTEWLDGCDLRNYLVRWGVMAQAEVAELALHLISGLMALHSGGASHGDLKPSSIFLCNGVDGDVIPKLVLSDLPQFNGLGRPVDSTTREVAISTPAYLPPEAIRGRSGGPKGDQYSLGAILYECAVGRAPFAGDTLLDLLKAVAIGTITPPRSLRPELSERLEDTLLRALSPDPDDRFATLRDLGRALWPLTSEPAKAPWAPSFGSELRDLPIRREPKPAIAPEPPPAPRRKKMSTALKPAAFFLLAASIALSIGIGAMYLYSVRYGVEPPPPIEPGGADKTSSGLHVRF